MCPTLCGPMDCSTPGFPVHHPLPELAQAHVHQAGDATNHFLVCCPLLLPPSIFPSIRVFSIFQWLSSSHQVAKVLEFSISPSNEIQDWFPLGLTSLISLQSEELSRVLQHHSSKTSVLWHSAFWTPSEFRIDDTRNVENQSRVEKYREMKLIERLYFSTRSEIILATSLGLLH